MHPQVQSTRHERHRLRLDRGHRRPKDDGHGKDGGHDANRRREARSLLEDRYQAGSEGVMLD